MPRPEAAVLAVGGPPRVCPAWECHGHGECRDTKLTLALVWFPQENVVSREASRGPAPGTPAHAAHLVLIFRSTCLPEKPRGTLCHLCRRWQTWPEGPHIRSASPQCYENLRAHTVGGMGAGEGDPKQFRETTGHRGAVRSPKIQAHESHSRPSG